MLQKEVTISLIGAGNEPYLGELANNWVSSFVDPENIAKGLFMWLAPLLLLEPPPPLVVQEMHGDHFVAYRPIKPGVYCKIDAFSSSVLNMTVQEVFCKMKEGLDSGDITNINAILPK